MLAFFQNLKEFLLVVFVIMIEGFRRKYSAVFKIPRSRPCWKVDIPK